MPTLNFNPTVRTLADSKAQGGAIKNVTPTKTNQNSVQFLWF
jgi:hypothetical protein